MDLISLIKSRRSIRRFQKRNIPPEIIIQVIEAACWAPSACNIQGWRFIVVDDEAKKQKIVDYGGSISILNSQVGILILYDNRTKNTEYHDDIQSAAAAIENLILYAHSIGLGTCWICHLPSKHQLRKIFNIPSFFSPIAYILLGYPEKETSVVPRKHTPKFLISSNTFSPKTTVDNPREEKVLLKKILMKLYFIVPVFIKKMWLNKFIDKKFVKKFEN